MDDQQRAYLKDRRDALLRRLGRVTSNPRILSAFAEVPREAFVPERQQSSAYEDKPLPLVEGQTISQPSMVAIMLDALDVGPKHSVLEVGAGSGYASALLGRLARHVHAVEIRPNLARMAEVSLARIGTTHVTLHVGNGRDGLPAHAPYDRILVSAGAEDVPSALLDSLAPGGRIVIPVGGGGEQEMRVGMKPESGAAIQWQTGVACVFVPLLRAEPQAEPTRNPPSAK